MSIIRIIDFLSWFQEFTRLWNLLVRIGSNWKYEQTIFFYSRSKLILHKQIHAVENTFWNIWKIDYTQSYHVDSIQIEQIF